MTWPKPLTPEEARDLGYDSWSIHTMHAPCNRGHNGYCATCDPHATILVVAPSDPPSYTPTTTDEEPLATDE